MKRVAFTLLVVVTACGGAAAVPAGELEPVLARDAVAFPGTAVPDDVAARLAGYDVVVVGETHLIREQRELTAALVTALHAHGLRQVLLEWPHMADWLLSEYVADGDRRPDWWHPPTWLLGDLITAIREFNTTLPIAERIAVRAIDVNLDEYGGEAEFEALLRTMTLQLSDPGPIAAFLAADHNAPDVHAAHLESLREKLVAGRQALSATWGAYWYDTISELVEVELLSVAIRADRDDAYDRSAREREDAMKQLVERRLEEIDGISLINVGGNHAQKERLKGTNQEWLGDYLAHRSEAAGGSVISLGVVPARITADYASPFPDFDLADASPDNELFLLLARGSPDRTVFLRLDDPLFTERRVAMNYEGEIYESEPARHYDAVVVLPLAHRIPIP